MGNPKDSLLHLLLIIFFGICVVLIWKNISNRNKDSLLDTENNELKLSTLPASKLPHANAQDSTIPNQSIVPFDVDDFKARYLSGATPEELADEFDCSIRSVQSRLRRYGLVNSSLESETSPIHRSPVKKPRQVDAVDSTELKKIKHLLRIEAITKQEYEQMIKNNTL